MYSETDKLERHNRELTILNSIAEALNREVDEKKAMRTTLAKVTELFNLRAGWIWLLREDTGAPYLAVAQHLPPVLINEPERMEGSDCYCLETYLEGDLRGAANVKIVTCTRLKYLIDGTDGIRHHASIPLYAHGKKLGVLNVASQDWRELSPDDLRLLYTVGDLLSMAIERARLFACSAEFGAAEERNRLAREIHDTLAQGLTAIALQLETAEALQEANADSEKIKTAIHKALELSRSNLEEARRSVLDLRAAPLEGRSLPDALRSLAEDTPTWSKLSVDFSCSGADRPLPMRIEVSLYRIVQEAITNMIRHANAEHASVDLTIYQERLELTIEDDGQGFDPDNVPKSRYGLIGMNERVRLLGGKLEICSCPGEGTEISINIPLESGS